ncbi:uncharacterized protein LOC123307700 isoform X2 [Coccinella septempunctata]|uniref:uncharacterized protein LOC123307700 isoform X2 n=1 Tax=Coccinella septempunctata TaxID=41139 RepID=UPI001D06F4AD|nr:uncharacterized protein LOC123307700 isoform X2 [Coccinella septempunctata]
MTVMLAVIVLLSSLMLSSCNENNFGFKSFEDANAQPHDLDTNWSAPYQRFIATSGRIFHLVFPRYLFGRDTSKFEAISDSGKPLPRWLIFDEINALLWGVPSDEDIGNISLIVKSLNSQKPIVRNIVIDVQPTSMPIRSVTKCSSSEDITLFSMLIDKWIGAIEPRQRIAALNDISKFFGIPNSAFYLKSLNVQDDPYNESVVLAGPGNIRKKTSNLTSILEVPIGCDGRIFPQYTAILHQLNHQAIEGTISEVIRLPIVGWKIKVYHNVAVRERRQALEQIPDGENGEYDGEYYDDYEDSENYEEDLGVTTHTSEFFEAARSPTIVNPTVSSVKKSEKNNVHPHRHHHGEAKEDGNMPIWTIVDDNSSGNNNIIPLTSPEVPKISPTTRDTATATKTATPTERATSAATTIKMQFPENIDTYVDNYENYKTGDYEDEEDDSGEIENQTIVPVSKATSRSNTRTTTTSTEQIIIEDDPHYKEKTTERDIVEQYLDNVGVEISYSTTPTSTLKVMITSKVENTIPTSTMFVTTSVPSTTVSTITSTNTSSTATVDTPSTTITPSTNNPNTETITTSTTAATPINTTTSTTSNPKITTTSTTTAISKPTYITTEVADKILEEELTTPTKLTTLIQYSSIPPPITTLSEKDNEVENEPPYIENRLKRKNVVAGKIFRFVIPEDTFKDSEDNYDLKLEFLDSDENTITANSWCQFNPHRREIYGLPLDDHVSKWEYIIRATDKEGAFVQDRLTILVQQHKLQRVFNLEFSLEIRIEKKDEFKHYVDWSLRMLRALGRIYSTNMSEITVKKVSFSKQPVVFTWSNDSLPTNFCPKNEIDKLYKMLTANDRGDPSRLLNNAVIPELRVKKVSYYGLGVCEEINTPIAPPVNYPPILRNPVNRINATVGELLIFRVPKDTFYDPEDLDTLSLNLTLLTGNRQEISPHNWLQFDSKNREFFGIPRKTSRSEYQLICIDSGGLPVIDSLEVVVFPASKVNYNVEFSMTIETSYDSFIDNSIIQKKFVDKLLEIFGDGNASHIQFLPFKQKQHSVIVTWYNKTLSTDKCPQDQIAKLESMMKNEERGISNRVHAIMEPDFQVSTIKVLPMSNCKVHKPKYHVPKMPEDRIIVDESSQTSSSSDQYLLTFIVPVFFISVMTFFAIFAACILYRRRRTGKMNVLEEGRQSYGNKGIPVIFQEELDEKPEAGTKAPIILKDEKPPLAPPEYSKSSSLKFTDDSEPYHPPPPFTKTQDNGKNSRPKPAPTYRKPPPYVPP